jgi:hypothetical protein
VIKKRTEVLAAIVSVGGGAAGALSAFIPAAQARQQEWYCYQPLSGRHQYIFDKQIEENLTQDGWCCTLISTK